MDLKCIEIASNIIIPVAGALNIYLISHTCKHKNRWGFILTSIGQPFWLFTTFYNHQWGIFVLSIWHTFCVVRGAHNRIKENNNGS